MSIKDQAINLYRKIWKSPNREEVQAVANKVKPGTFGVGNKGYPAPILGLLLYEQRRVQALLNKDFWSELESWPERDREILFGVHEQIRLLNEQCLAPLASELPQGMEAINPYKKPQQPVPIETGLLFSEEDAKELIQSFHEHPAFDIALSTLPILKERRHSFAYDQTIPAMVSQIDEAKPGTKIAWFEGYEEARRLKYDNLPVYRHVGAVLSLHSSLAALDQLIIQALYSGELLRLTRENIVDYVWTMGGPGPRMWLQHISDLHMYVCEAADLIVVNIDRAGKEHGLGDVLCRIYSSTIPGTDGGPATMELNMLNENLNAYGYLV
jgi:hypothetical protein